ncbi:hypothetical protein AVEN_8440-1 [Araneus ventricosus]|uniref:Uncharacterized protein n=1 Tax=Araneus ventricosus TaxID=182803 RepID=A0A4Y2IFQ3_ARAVE|nr:hypothetical protein AVEN_8440-1 [Araneus ventricosus]
MPPTCCHESLTRTYRILLFGRWLPSTGFHHHFSTCDQRTPSLRCKNLKSPVSFSCRTLRSDFLPSGRSPNLDFFSGNWFNSRIFLVAPFWISHETRDLQSSLLQLSFWKYLSIPNFFPQHWCTVCNFFTRSSEKTSAFREVPFRCCWISIHTPEVFGSASYLAFRVP